MSQVETAVQYVYSPLALIEELCELVDQFVAEMPGRVATIEEQCSRRDWESLGRTAHQLKGAAGSYGFDCVTPVAYRLEKAARSSAAESEITAAANELAALCRRLKAGTP